VITGERSEQVQLEVLERHLSGKESFDLADQLLLGFRRLQPNPLLIFGGIVGQ
jgi:hypothetical protein